MVKPEAVMDIRSLSKQGYSIRAIARMTGLNRRSVKKYLCGEELPVYHKKNRISLLDNYRDLITDWLNQENYQASKIHELLRCQGFKGSKHPQPNFLPTCKLLITKCTNALFQILLDISLRRCSRSN